MKDRVAFLDVVGVYGKGEGDKPMLLLRRLPSDDKEHIYKYRNKYYISSQEISHLPQTKPSESTCWWCRLLTW